MAIDPAVPTELGIGAKMISTWFQVVRSHDDLYTLYQSHVATRFGLNRTTDETSATTLCRFRMRKNTDNVPLVIQVYAKCLDQNGSIIVVVDGTDTVTQSITAGTTPAHFEITITPTTSTDPKEVLIKGAVTSGGTLHLLGFSAWVSASAIGTGALTSGYRTAPHVGTVTTAGRTINTERLSRITNGPKILAKDRPHCILSLITGEYERDFEWITSKSSLIVVARAWLPIIDEEMRTYRYDVHLQSAGGSVIPKLRMSVDGMQVTASEISGTGWHTGTFEQIGKMHMGTIDHQEGGDIKYLPVECQMKYSGVSGDVSLVALQIFREPS